MHFFKWRTLGRYGYLQVLVQLLIHQSALNDPRSLLWNVALVGASLFCDEKLTLFVLKEKWENLEA